MPESESESELFGRVDALLAKPRPVPLPPPEERKRLREAHNLKQEQVAETLSVSRQTLAAWESGKTDPPNGDQRKAYARLLNGLLKLYPNNAAADGEDTSDATPPPIPETFTAAPSHPSQAAPPKAAQSTPATPRRPAQPANTATSRPPTSRRPSKKAAPARTHQRFDPNFPSGPLAVLDGDGRAYCAGGEILDCPAKTLPALVEWVLKESGLGAARVNPHSKDQDPLVVLTASAVERFGLPASIPDDKANRLPDGHKVIKALTKAKWQLTRRGFGPWPKIYRPVGDDKKRQCVQLAMLPWHAFDARSWGGIEDLEPAEIATVLHLYATLLITPRGGTAVTGQELMAALRPPTRAVEDPEGSGTYISAPNPGARTHAVDPAPPEATDTHPVAVALHQRGPRTPAEKLDEEAFDWTRDPDTLTAEEAAKRYAVGIDINAAYLAAASRLIVGLGEWIHIPKPPTFLKDLPGSWLIDLSMIELDERLPSPFTPHGMRPTGPAWYSTTTVAYAYELIERLGLKVNPTPLEAYVYPNTEQITNLGMSVPPAAWERGDTEALERLGLADKSEAWLRALPRFANGDYFAPWYKRMTSAYKTLMADIGATGTDMSPADYLTAMATHDVLRKADRRDGDALIVVRQKLPEVSGLGDEELLRLIGTHQRTAMVLSALKGTVKGGIGKMREGARDVRIRAGEPWDALKRATWSPHARAELIAKARTNMHRKMMALAEIGLYPIGALTDCAVYMSNGPSPLDFLPYAADGKPLPGTFKLGASPGLVKHEGTQQRWWVEEMLGAGDNPARYIKGDATEDDGE